MAKIIGFYNMSNFYKEHCMCCGKKTAKKRLSFDKADTFICKNSCIFSIPKINIFGTPLTPHGTGRLCYNKKRALHQPNFVGPFFIFLCFSGGCCPPDAPRKKAFGPSKNTSKTDKNQ